MTIGLVAAGLLGACAHQQPTAVSEQKPPAPAQAAAPTPPPACPPGMPCEGDLSAVLRQTVLNFDFDKAILTPLSQDRLRVLADVLKKYPSAHILIAGHCDERGADEYNLALGLQRSHTAKRYLVALGIGEERVDTISYGFHRPVDQRHNQQAWAMNRRDEFSVKPANPATVSTREDLR